MKLTSAALVLVIVALPWYVLRWQMAGLPTTVLEVSIGLLALAWLYEDRSFWRPSEMVQVWHRYRWVIIATVVFVAAALLDTIVSPDHRQALGILKAYILEPIFVAVVVVRLLWLYPDRWRWVTAALAVTGVVVSLIAIAQLVVGWPNLAPAELAQGRASSLFNTANAVGLLVGPIVLMSLALALGRQLSVGWRCGYAVVVALGLVAIAGSGSAGAWLALSASVIVLGLGYVIRPLLASSRRAQLMAVTGLTVYTVACLGYVWWFNHPPEVANPYTRPGFSTFTVRQCLWQGTKHLLESSPVVGAGLAGFASQYATQSTCDAEPLVYPHMLVLNFWVETGLLGLVGMVGLLAGWMWRGVAIVWRQDASRWLGWATLLPLVYWLVHGVVDVPYFKNDLAIAWWLFLAMSVSISKMVSGAQSGLAEADD